MHLLGGRTLTNTIQYDFPTRRIDKPEQSERQSRLSAIKTYY